MTINADDADTLEYGTLVTNHKEKEKDKEDNVLLQEYLREDSHFHTNTTLPEFRQSNKSKDFIAGNTENENLQERTNVKKFIDRGLLYHAILQEIRTLDDIDRVIDKMNTEGTFSSSAELDEVSHHIHTALSDPFTAHWFSPHWRVVNERAILAPTDKNGEWKELRADRVILSDDETIVIDYKTGKPNKDHEKQVVNYMQLLTQMGYPNVKGYLWYIMTGKTKKVKIEDWK
jgi:CRISPR/Cas system-associated exonuclease Cas4 (RecB family)